jgi:hypothetical protein
LAKYAFPTIPGINRPHEASAAYRLDFGPHWTQGVLAIEPPIVGQPYPVSVPQVDADGNEIAGVRLPDIAVPTGMFTGWNLYRAPMPEGELADRDGTYLAFDGARYPSKEAYAARVREVVGTLQAERLLLEDDATAYLERARP